MWTYLSGTNSRRIRKALKPLLGEEHLSKSAVSRMVSRLKVCFEEWQNRDLSEEVYAIVYLDGFHLIWGHSSHLVLTVQTSALVQGLLLDFVAHTQDVRSATVIHVGRR